MIVVEADAEVKVVAEVGVGVGTEVECCRHRLVWIFLESGSSSAGI